MSILSFLGGGADQSVKPTIDQSNFNNIAGNQAQPWNTAANNYLGSTQGSAPTIGPVAQAANPNELAAMQGTAQTLQNTASGIGPSVAATTAQQQGANNYAAALGSLGAARGGMSPALASYLGQQAQGTTAQNTAQNATLGRAQEAMTAQGQLGQVQNNIANTQAGTNQFNAGATNIVNTQNAANILANKNLNNQAYENYMNQLTGQVNNSNQMNQNYGSLVNNNDQAFNALQSNNYNAAAGRGQAIVSSTLSAIGQAAGGMAQSDRRSKFKIKKADIALKELLSSSTSYLGAT